MACEKFGCGEVDVVGRTGTETLYFKNITMNTFVNYNFKIK